MEKLQLEFVNPLIRLKALNALRETFEEQDAEVIESSINAYSPRSERIYKNKAIQLIYNITINSNIAQTYPLSEIASLSNEVMAKGTAVESMQMNEERHVQHIENVLKEKYEGVSSQTENAPLRCRTCNSTDISWDQKQTRGADESMTIFCSCNKCKSRWKMS